MNRGADVGRTDCGGGVVAVEYGEMVAGEQLRRPSGRLMYLVCCPRDSRQLNILSPEFRLRTPPVPSMTSSASGCAAR